MCGSLVKTVGQGASRYAAPHIHTHGASPGPGAPLMVTAAVHAVLTLGGGGRGRGKRGWGGGRRGAGSVGDCGVILHFCFGRDSCLFYFVSCASRGSLVSENRRQQSTRMIF